MSVQVIIADSDRVQGTALKTYLSDVGMSVELTDSSASIYELIAKRAFDVAIISAAINNEYTQENGLCIATRLRQTSNMGVVVTSASHREDDRVHALTLGIDYFCTYPLNAREVEAVIRNIYRRLNALVVPPNISMEPTTKDHHSWGFDTKRWVLTSPSGHSVSLSIAEYHFLASLVSQAGIPVSREEVLNELNKVNAQEGVRNLDTTLFRLRRKVEDECREALPVRSARGVGYVFAADVEVVESPLRAV